MTEKLRAVRARQVLYAATRTYLAGAGFDEVETPYLVPAPGMEPAITAFESRFTPEMGAARERPLWLHTSPEYAMKRLLADGHERIFQIARVFRNGEVAPIHNPEFTMLEFYRAGLSEGARAGRGYGPILHDLEELCAAGAVAVAGAERIAVGGAEVDLTPPWDRISVQEAFASRAGIDLPMDGDLGLLREQALARGFHAPAGSSFDDLFFSVFLTAIEPGLGWPRPTFLVDWPAPMASLARLREDDPNVAERFELYIGGMELANGFFELNDAAEQRRRLEHEQDLRRTRGRPVYPIDDRFVEAVGRMPSAAGVALGLDRLLMLLGGFATIGDVLLFPRRPGVGVNGKRTVRAWAGMLGATMAAGAPALTMGLLTFRRWHRTDVFPRLFTHLSLRACGVRVVARGFSRFDPSRNFVMVSNHQSFLDPISIVAVMPQKIRFLAKREILYLPLFGWAAWAVGNIFVKRERHGSARGSLEKAERVVGRDISVLFFAEGTRSQDGTLGPFKPGASLMALRAGVAVLPMALAGTAELFPRGGRPIRPGTVGLAVGSPIEIDRQNPGDRDALTARIRAEVEALLPEAEEARRTGRGEASYPPLSVRAGTPS